SQGRREPFPGGFEQNIPVLHAPGKHMFQSSPRSEDAIRRAHLLEMRLADDARLAETRLQYLSPGSVQNRDVLVAASRGATHASHGLTREGQPRTVSRRSLRNRFTAAPGGRCCSRGAAVETPHSLRPKDA